MLVSFSPASIADLDSMYDYIIWGGQKQPQSEKKRRWVGGGGGGGGGEENICSVGLSITTVFLGNSLETGF